MKDSIVLKEKREAANIAFDELNRQWRLLENICEPTLEDLEPWLESRKIFFIAQDQFEDTIRQIHKLQGRD